MQSSPPATPTKRSVVSRSSPRKPHAEASPQVKAALQAIRSRQQSAPQLSNSELDPASVFSAPTEAAFLDWGLKSIEVLLEGSYTSGSLNLASRELSRLPSALFPSRESQSSDTKPLDSLSLATPTPTTPWYSRAPLRSLNASNNTLDELEEEIGELQDLNVLDLRANRLATLPSSFTLLTSLTSLNLSNNNLSELPVPLFKLPALTRLTLDANAISTVPAVADDDVFPSLRLLDLSRNKIIHLEALEALLSKRAVVWTGLPAAIDVPETQLDGGRRPLEVRTHGNPFSNFPRRPRPPTSPIMCEEGGDLVDVGASPAPEEETPASPPTSPPINEGITEGGEDITGLVIGLDQLAVEIEADNLKSPSGQEGPVEKPPAEEPSDTAGLAEAPVEPDPETETFIINYFDPIKGVLDASSQELAALPPSAPSAPLAIASVDLSHNLLPAFDLRWIAAWDLGHSIRRLNLSRNRIAAVTTISTAAFALPQLSDLNVSMNRLESSISVDGEDTPLLSLIARTAPHLSHLDLSYNKLTSTAGIADLISPLAADGRTVGLRSLSLAFNTVHDLSGLVDVATKFRDLGRRARGTWQCSQLILTNNSIAQLPPVLGHLPHDGFQLLVEGNLFRIPRREVYIDGGSKGLLEYLLDRC